MVRVRVIVRNTLTLTIPGQPCTVRVLRTGGMIGYRGCWRLGGQW